jgi:integrase
MISQVRIVLESVEWPEEARGRWLSAFDGSGQAAASWEPVTRYTCARVFSRVLAAGRAEDALLECEPWITRQAIRAFITECEKRGVSARTIEGYVHNTLQVLTIVAEDAYRAGKLDWLIKTRGDIRTVASRTPKARHKLFVTAPQLLEAAYREIDGALRLPTGEKRFVSLRDGTILAFGCYVPERRRAIAATRIDWINVRQRRIEFPAEVRKNKERMAWSVPPSLLDLLSLWLSESEAYRTDPTGNIWITMGGKPCCDATVYKAIVEVTQRQLGYRCPPHMLRHAAATALAECSPEDATLARSLLDHNSEAITREYTQLARRLAASQRLNAITKKVRDSL